MELGGPREAPAPARPRGAGVAMRVAMRVAGGCSRGPDPFPFSLSLEPESPAPWPWKATGEGIQRLRLEGLCTPSFVKGRVAAGGGEVWRQGWGGDISIILKGDFAL